jgi:glycosyltransferase involved in cell wall biosynthesis
MRIAILTPTLRPADAVSNDVLTMRDVLRARGHDVAIFAESSSVTGEPELPPETALPFLREPSDVLIYHHSIGWPTGIPIFKVARCRKIVKYHNITPPHFFDGISKQHQRLCETGRAQVHEIVGAQPDLYLAASTFNRFDLIAAGSDPDKTFVVPPFNQTDQLLAQPADFEVLNEYDDTNVNLLTVGGVRPNKGHADLIEAFALYYYTCQSRARLFIVGAEDDVFKPYADRLRKLIDGWSIASRVEFTGEISLAELKSYYLLADALLMTSEHEGFSVPLVEAMAMKVPIVAYASTAIPETAQDAALIWNERDPFLMAQSIAFLQANEDARMELVYRGSQRYAENFSNHAIEKRFLDVTTQAGFAF